MQKKAGERRGRDAARGARKGPPRGKAGAKPAADAPRTARKGPPRGKDGAKPGADAPRTAARKGPPRGKAGAKPAADAPRTARKGPPRGKDGGKVAGKVAGRAGAQPAAGAPRTAVEGPARAAAPRGDRKGPRARPVEERRAPPPPRPKKDAAAPLPDGPPRTGTVAIVGRPNVGKSTLLNAALEMPLAIVSPTPQTTRDALLGVVHHGTAEIGLLDTPGLFAGQTALDRAMLRAASEAAEGADVVVFVTALSRNAAQAEDALRPHAGDVALLRGLPEGAQVVVVVNKIDLLRDKRRLLPLLAELGAVRPVAAVVPVSALREDGVRRVLDEVAQLLPEGEHRFGADDVTDRPARFFAREYVREQILLATREEVPHAVAVSIDGWQEGEGRRATRVSATIHVERPGQKKILVGAGGAMLTRIGSRARARLAELVGRPVHLELFVRVTEDWRQRSSTLRDLGYGGEAEGEGGVATMFVADLPGGRSDDVAGAGRYGEDDDEDGDGRGAEEAGR